MNPDVYGVQGMTRKTLSFAIFAAKLYSEHIFYRSYDTLSGARHSEHTLKKEI